MSSRPRKTRGWGRNKSYSCFVQTFYIQYNKYFITTPSTLLDCICEFDFLNAYGGINYTFKYVIIVNSFTYIMRSGTHIIFIYSTLTPL